MRTAMIFVFTTLIYSFGCSSAFAQTFYNTDYELVAKSQTTQTLGPTGGAGDILERCIIVPETLAAGTVAIKDGSGTAINIMVAGTLSDLKPHIVVIGARSSSGAWQVTTGDNVHVICVGKFK